MVIVAKSGRCISDRSPDRWVGRPQTDTWTTTTRLHVNQSDGRTDSAKNVAPSRGTRARMVERARRPQWIIGIGKFHKMRESAWPFERRVDGLGCFAETLFDRRPTTLSLSALSLKENHPRSADSVADSFSRSNLRESI